LNAQLFAFDSELTRLEQQVDQHKARVANAAEKKGASGRKSTTKANDRNVNKCKTTEQG
jgi:hypothetical protein